ncbi:MAG: hypothetical protein H7Z41_11590 [Cytophagales bacterium]|nr:hypothetical protein [Armatimonadota bacterium]
MNRRDFGNLVLGIFCLGVFAGALVIFRGLAGGEGDTAPLRPALFWALVSVAVTLSLFYSAILLLRRHVPAKPGTKISE